MVVEYKMKRVVIFNKSPRAKVKQDNKGVGMLGGLYGAPKQAVGVLWGLYKALKMALKPAFWLLCGVCLLCNSHVLLSIYFGDTPVAELLKDIHPFSVITSRVAWMFSPFVITLAYADRDFRAPVKPRELWPWGATVLFYFLFDPSWGVVPNKTFDSIPKGRWVWIPCFVSTLSLVHPCYGLVTFGGKKSINYTRGLSLALLIVSCLSCTSYITYRALEVSDARLLVVEGNTQQAMEDNAEGGKSYDESMREWLYAGYELAVGVLPQSVLGIIPQSWRDKFASQNPT
jgi:hypothetical protein